ncbi:hypothetical protein ES288_D10G135100v1 [Gossypium darwinii]|uniref:Uncharacterized protein n=1 Tax=Gossypium darwinii TaxID=34276 RepID=A0A5D2B0Z0_GOSDA|nr:hypothetical protein ES288_D10G135100v1 [Gossypium darwinii]
MKRGFKQISYITYNLCNVLFKSCLLALTFIVQTAFGADPLFHFFPLEKKNEYYLYQSTTEYKPIQEIGKKKERESRRKQT